MVTLCDRCMAEMPRENLPLHQLRCVPRDPDVNVQTEDSPGLPWTCPRCTYENLRSLWNCEVCLEPRVPPEQRVSEAAGEQSEQIGAGSIGAFSGALAGAYAGFSRGSRFLAAVLAGLGAYAGERLGRIMMGFNGSSQTVPSGTGVPSSQESQPQMLAAHGSRGSQPSQRVGEIRVRQFGPVRIVTFSGGDLRALRRAVSEVDLLQQLLLEQRRPITCSSVAALPTRELTQEDIAAAEQKACSICMEEFASGDKQRTMPCFHQFHQACLDKWLTRQGTCPICKFDVDRTH